MQIYNQLFGNAVLLFCSFSFPLLFLYFLVLRLPQTLLVLLFSFPLSWLCRVELCWSTTGSRTTSLHNNVHSHLLISPGILPSLLSIDLKNGHHALWKKKCFVLFCFIVKKNMGKGKHDCLEGEPGARGGLVLDLLKVSSCSKEFFLVTVACRAQALGFSKPPRDSGYCNRSYINKDELEFESGG